MEGNESMTLDPNTVRFRLSLILDYLDELRPLTALTLEEFLSDRYKTRAAERVLEITIQAALDINNHLLKEQFRVSKKSNSDGFLELGQFSVLQSQLAQDMHESGSFRNRLAHRYYAVDSEMVFQIIFEALAQYPEYVQQIENFLDSLEENNE
jgi:uncharacterized protein YutE (UPF0331/DUF86 family)